MDGLPQAVTPPVKDDKKAKKDEDKKEEKKEDKKEEKKDDEKEYDDEMENMRRGRKEWSSGAIAEIRSNSAKLQSFKRVYLDLLSAAGLNLSEEEVCLKAARGVGFSCQNCLANHREGASGDGQWVKHRHGLSDDEEMAIYLYANLRSASVRTVSVASLPTATTALERFLLQGATSDGHITMILWPSMDHAAGLSLSYRPEIAGKAVLDTMAKEAEEKKEDGSKNDEKEGKIEVKTEEKKDAEKKDDEQKEEDACLDLPQLALTVGEWKMFGIVNSGPSPIAYRVKVSSAHFELGYNIGFVPFRQTVNCDIERSGGLNVDCDDHLKITTVRVTEEEMRTKTAAECLRDVGKKKRTTKVQLVPKSG